MKNILIVSGHNDLTNSIANKAILEELSKVLPNAEFDYLDKLYPDYKIDVAKEQEKLLKADVVVLQFPIYWYNAPALLRKWFEDVLLHGFAHGSTGTKLHGKHLIVSCTAGAPEAVYCEGMVGKIDDFMPSFIQLANLCGMKWEGYVCTYDVSYLSRTNENFKQDVIQKAIKHANDLAKKINSL